MLHHPVDVIRSYLYNRLHHHHHYHLHLFIFTIRHQGQNEAIQSTLKKMPLMSPVLLLMASPSHVSDMIAAQAGSWNKPNFWGDKYEIPFWKNVHFLQKEAGPWAPGADPATNSRNLVRAPDFSEGCRRFCRNKHQFERLKCEFMDF